MSCLGCSSSDGPLCPRCRTILASQSSLERLARAEGIVLDESLRAFAQNVAAAERAKVIAEIKGRLRL